MRHQEGMQRCPGGRLLPACASPSTLTQHNDPKGGVLGGHPVWLAGPMGEGKEILHKHKNSNADEVVVPDLEEGLFCLHVEAAALLSPSFKQTARRPSLMRKPSGREASECAAACFPCSMWPMPVCTVRKDAMCWPSWATALCRHAGSGSRTMHPAPPPPHSRLCQVRGNPAASIPACTALDGSHAP